MFVELVLTSIMLRGQRGQRVNLGRADDAGTPDFPDTDVKVKPMQANAVKRDCAKAEKNTSS